MVEPIGLQAFPIDGFTPIVVGPGCIRRDLPSRDGVRTWIVEMEPGSEWPWLDQHDGGGEDVFVIDGELVEGSQRHGVGTYLQFGPNSSHRPRTEIGVRLIGFNLLHRASDK